MPLSQKDLDGRYAIETIYDSRGPYPIESEGVTEIDGGRADRYDRKGIRWMARLTVLNDDAVRFDSTVDPLEADDDVRLIGRGGRPTREPVDWTAVLDVGQTADGDIRLSGEIVQGRIRTVIRMTKIYGGSATPCP
jgi:hypothetical protein